MDIAVLFSGRGTNMKSIIERSLRKDARYSVRMVATDNPTAPGIQIAHELGKTCVIAGKRNWEWHLYDALNYYQVKLVVLAGFMKILPTLFCTRWKKQCINIHPSLLPKYKGLHTHKRALEARDKEHGCSIHYVTPELDAGPVIAQSRIGINDDDTEETLALRVLQQENILYPEVIQNIAIRRIAANEKAIWFDGNEIESPLVYEDLLVNDTANTVFHHSV